MPREIIEGPESFCPKNCPVWKLEIQDASLYANDLMHIHSTILRCENEPVCRMWVKLMEKGDMAKTCKGCKYDGKDCSNPHPCFRMTSPSGQLSGWTPMEKENKDA